MATQNINGRTLMPGVQRFLIYAAVGATGTACQYAVLVLLVQSGLARPVLASSIGACMGAIVNYALNYRITFKSRAGIWQTAGRFASIAVAGIGLNAILMHLMTVTFALNYLLAQACATALVLVLTYSANRLWTFGSKRAGTER